MASGSERAAGIERLVLSFLSSWVDKREVQKGSDGKENCNWDSGSWKTNVSLMLKPCNVQNMLAGRTWCGEMTNVCLGGREPGLDPKSSP